MSERSVATWGPLPSLCVLGMLYTITRYRDTTDAFVFVAYGVLDAFSQIVAEVAEVQTTRAIKFPLIARILAVTRRDPRLIRRACMSGWRKGQDGGNQTEAHKSVQDDSSSRRCHCHPTAEEGSGRNGRAFTSNYWLLSTTCSRREGPIGRRRIIHARAASDLTTEVTDPPEAALTVES